MTQPSPFSPPPGPVRQYVDRAHQLATKNQTDLSADMAAGVAAFAKAIHEHADALVPASDRLPFLQAVKGQVRASILALGTPEQIAANPGLSRKCDTLGLIVGAIRT